MTRMFASLGIRNYRLFFLGGLVSNVGTWMARVAQDWLVLTELTDHSATALGLVTGLQFAPIALLSPWGGAVADRFPKRTVMMVTQVGLCLTGLTLAALVLTGSVELWHVYALAMLGGAFSAFDNPARQAIASEIVPSHLLTNAVGLNSTSFNAARLVGPGVAGLTIAAWGVGPAIALNGLSFLASLAGLIAMRQRELTPAPQRRGKGAIREGLRYVRNRPDLMTIMVIVFMLGTFGLNFQLTNALMATRVFGVGAEAYGLLGTIQAVGTLAAALIAARRTRPRLRLIVGALGAFSLVTTALAFAPGYVNYAILLVPVGVAALTVMTAANAFIQLTTEPSMRGRVMALYMAIFMGGTPFGAPLVGWVGDAWGPRWTLIIGAAATGLTFVVVGAILGAQRWR
ncbi:MAG: MFS transporter, partial [Micropruina sp.]